MADSEFNKTLVFRTDIAYADLSTSAIRSVLADRIKLSGDAYSFEPLTADDVEKWDADATEFARETDKADIAGRFARLKPDFQTPQQDAADQAMWSGWEEASLALDPAGAQQRRRLATILGDLACEVNGEPFVARALVTRLTALGDQLDRVRDRFKEGRKNPETCPGVAGFSADDWRKVDAITPAHD